jgi:hypothetical protein
MILVTTICRPTMPSKLPDPVESVVYVHVSAEDFYSNLVV